jgi:hypothetical protein
MDVKMGKVPRGSACSANLFDNCNDFCSKDVSDRCQGRATGGRARVTVVKTFRSRLEGKQMFEDDAHFAYENVFFFGIFEIFSEDCGDPFTLNEASRLTGSIECHVS